jgi:hypothetical protein
VRKNRLAELIGKLFPSIQGALPVIPDNGSMPDQVGLINAIISANPFPATAYNAPASTGAFTATQQQIMSAEVNVLNVGALTGAAAITLPTAATMLATMTPFQAQVGASTTLRVMNPSASTATVTTNTGWTLNGTMTVLTQTFRDFFVTCVGTGASAAFILQDIGSGSATAE